MKVLQVANYQEGIGGIAVQVKLLRDKLRGEGIECEIVSTKGSLLDRIGSVVKLLTKGKRFDVFHVHACSGLGFFPAVVGVTVGRLLKKRLVLTYHGGGAEAFFQKRERLVKRYLNKTAHNIVLSGYTGSIFDRYGIKYTVVPNIMEPDETVFRKRTEIKPRYLSIRSLTEIYNVGCSLRAFRKVQDVFPDAELTILGDGPLREPLMASARELGLEHVSFVGQVPNEKLSSFFDKADIMITSSRFDNMPVSVLEGFKAGLLVIASRVGGIPYMIEDGRNGLLFDSDDADMMAAKMLEAVERPGETLRMIAAAVQSLDAYSWNRIKLQLYPLYAE